MGAGDAGGDELTRDPAYAPQGGEAGGRRESCSNRPFPVQPPSYCPRCPVWAGVGSKEPPKESWRGRGTLPLAGCRSRGGERTARFPRASQACTDMPGTLELRCLCACPGPALHGTGAAPTAVPALSVHVQACHGSVGCRVLPPASAFSTRSALSTLNGYAVALPQWGQEKKTVPFRRSSRAFSCASPPDTETAWRWGGTFLFLHLCREGGGSMAAGWTGLQGRPAP